MKFLLILTLAGTLRGQRIVYNQDLAKKGQEAASASKRIASDPLSSQELQNLKVIEKQQIDGTLKAGYVTMRTSIQSFDKWTRVSRSVCATLRQLYAADETKALKIAADRIDHLAFDKTCDPNALQQEAKAASDRKRAVRLGKAQARRDRAKSKNSNSLSTEATTVEASISSLANDIESHITNAKRETVSKSDQEIAVKAQRRVKDQKGARATIDPASQSSSIVDLTASAKSALDSALDRLGNVDELLKAAKEVGISGNQNAEDALSKIEDGLKQIDALIGSVHTIWATYADVQVDPRSLIPSKEKLAASLLALDAERIKELAAIRAANALYLGDLQTRLEDCVSLLSAMKLWYSNDSVETTLTSTSDPSQRYNAIYCLHLAAAGAAVNQTPFATEAVRESIAQRRYSIRRDGVYNGAYEQALRASADRLSAYYAAGVTKNQIAQLLYYLSGLVSLPKLAFGI